jgi:O-antigen/teichoic acid export membrane protein
LFANKNNFSFYFSITVISSLLTVLIGLVTGVLTARILGPSGRGELGTIQLYGSLASSILTSGLPIALTYYSLRYTRLSSTFFFSTIFIALVFSLIIAPFFYYLIPYLLRSSPALVDGAQLYLWFIPLGILTACLLAYTQGIKNIILWNITRLLASIYWLIPILFIFFLKINLSAQEISVIYLISLIIYIITFLYIIYIYSPLKFIINWRYCIKIVKFGVPNTFYTFSQLSNTKLDLIFISYFLMSKDTGLYIIAVSWSTAHLPLTNAVSSIILPHLSSIKNKNHKFQFFNQTLRINTMINVTVAILIIIISPFVIPLLFGKSYVDSIQLSNILLLGTVFSNLKLTIGEAIRSIGLASKLLKSEFIALILSPILFYIFLRHFKLNGIAIGFLLINSISLFYMTSLYISQSGSKIKSLFVLNKSDIEILKNRFKKI